MNNYNKTYQELVFMGLSGLIKKATRLGDNATLNELPKSLKNQRSNPMFALIVNASTGLSPNCTPNSCR